MKQKMFLFSVFVIMLTSVLSAQIYNLESTEHLITDTYIEHNDEQLSVIDQMIAFGKQYLGKPYRYRLQNGHILDCSGFVYHIFSFIGIQLAYSSAAIAHLVEKIPLEQVQKGDLLFFKGRDINNQRIGHVSIVTDLTDQGIEMMHSCRRGVITEIYNNNRYYTDRFLFAGRLPQLAEMLKTSTHDTHEIETIASLPENYELAYVSEPSPEQTSEEFTLTIIAVGDIMLGTNFPNNSSLPPNDGKELLEHAKIVTKTGDIVFGNLEGCFLTGDGPVKKCANPDKCYAFKMPDHYVNLLLEANFNLLSIANNHIGDFGDVGRRNTVRVLKDAGIHFAGLVDYPYTTFEVKGVKVGFAAFAPNTGTVNLNEYNTVRQIISHLDTTCQIVIVSFHGGAEGPSHLNITRKTEYFLGENRGNPYEFARVAIDAGADVVLGHGPHVPRAIDLYKGKFIAYSLGNFATYGRFSIAGPNGLAPAIEIVVDKEGNFIRGKIHSFRQFEKGKPTLDQTHAAARKIAELTRNNIPEAPLDIDDEGNITLK